MLCHTASVVILVLFKLFIQILNILLYWQVTKNLFILKYYRVRKGFLWLLKMSVEVLEIFKMRQYGALRREVRSAKRMRDYFYSFVLSATTSYLIGLVSVTCKSHTRVWYKPSKCQILVQHMLNPTHLDMPCMEYTLTITLIVCVWLGGFSYRYKQERNYLPRQWVWYLIMLRINICFYKIN